MRNIWQRFELAWYRRKNPEAGLDVFEKIVQKLIDNGLVERNDSGNAVLTHKGLRAIRNRRADYDVGWWTADRDRWITRVMAAIAVVVSIFSLLVHVLE